MKRLAILVLLAALGPASAADIPLPTGMASTEPTVPAPVSMGGVPNTSVSFRDRLGIGTTYEAPVVAESVSGPRLWNRMLSWRPCKDCVLFQAPTWCDNCAPAVKRPLPPLPAGLSAGHCATGQCEAPAKASGSCCEKLKNWVCFRYSTVRMPIQPTAKEPALYTYFQTQERAGVCAGGNCATGGHGGKLRAGCATGAACVPCPAPGEAIVPGYRLANP